MVVCIVCMVVCMVEFVALLPSKWMDILKFGDSLTLKNTIWDEGSTTGSYLSAGEFYQRIYHWLHLEMTHRPRYLSKKFKERSLNKFAIWETYVKISFGNVFQKQDFFPIVVHCPNKGLLGREGWYLFITVWGVPGEMPDAGVFSLKVLELTLVREAPPCLLLKWGRRVHT